MGIWFYRSTLSRKLAEARALAALLGLEAQGWTLTDLAASLGRERSGLHPAAGRLPQRKAREPGPGPEKGLMPSEAIAANTHKSSLTPIPARASSSRSPPGA